MEAFGFGDDGQQPAPPAAVQTTISNNLPLHHCVYHLSTHWSSLFAALAIGGLTTMSCNSTSDVGCISAFPVACMCNRGLCKVISNVYCDLRSREAV
eukprot:scaffold77050_cov44-Cyclotella_meneghiniana.AAC.1